MEYCTVDYDCQYIKNAVCYDYACECKISKSYDAELKTCGICMFKYDIYIIIFINF